jgi:hypothetical protein
MKKVNGKDMGTNEGTGEVEGREKDMDERGILMA